MASRVVGIQELTAAFKELGDMTSHEWRSTMRASVAAPANRVAKQARANIAAISPGKAESHATYKGRIVAAGFASRSIKTNVRINPRRGYAMARIGVKREAYYALSFFEMGVPSRGIRRSPWLVPALKSQLPVVVNDVNVAMKRRIEQIARKRARVAAKAAQSQ